MSESERQLVVRGPQAIAPAEEFRRATDVAGVCREIVKRTVKRVGNKDYVCVEGWQSIATAHGTVASIEEVEECGEGVRAVASLRRVNDGTMIARAEGYVGDDEPTWAKRPRYARRAMAQTRAISRVCRSAFAHVVVLIDANLSTTPAEEMIIEVDGVSHAPRAVSRMSEAEPSQPATRLRSVPRDDLSDAGREPTGPDDGAEIWRGVRVEVKEHQSPPDAPRKWTRWEVRTDTEQRASTFDAKMGEALTEHAALEQEIDLMVRPGKKQGTWDIVRVQIGGAK